MPKINIILADDTTREIQANSGDNILDILLKNNIYVEHACEMQCACTTCHVYVRQGNDSLTEASDKEDEMLDQAWGLDLDSRLSCQLQMGDKDLIIKIPKYTLNQVAETPH